MAAVRPAVSVFNAEGEKSGGVGAPAVFNTPLRPDLVDFVTKQMWLNSRQAYALSTNAGYQTAAISWGTGRAVSRIPRAPGGGTHRSGQGAFGNMCRGGGMFNPTKTWRRWHHKIPLKQRRHAMASAIASTAVTPLVMARGHRLSEVPELPLVVKGIEDVKRTRDAAVVLEKLGLQEELKAVLNSRKVRVGRGKIRNRRYVMKKGPLLIWNEDDGIVKAFRNIPGIELMNVNKMNLMKLAPGGHLGRLIIWTEGAFKQLKPLFGTGKGPAGLKKGYRMHRPVMANADLHRIINSDEIQSVVRPMKEGGSKFVIKKNGLKNKVEMDKLNPGASHRAALRKKLTEKGSTQYETLQRKKKVRMENAKKHKALGKEYYRKLVAAYKAKPAPEAEEEADEE